MTSSLISATVVSSLQERLASCSPGSVSVPKPSPFAVKHLRGTQAAEAVIQTCFGQSQKARLSRPSLPAVTEGHHEGPARSIQSTRCPKTFTFIHSYSFKRVLLHKSPRHREVNLIDQVLNGCWRRQEATESLHGIIRHAIPSSLFLFHLLPPSTSKTKKT